MHFPTDSLNDKELHEISSRLAKMTPRKRLTVLAVELGKAEEVFQKFKVDASLV